jgi:hypothetical protein
LTKVKSLGQACISFVKIAPLYQGIADVTAILKPIWRGLLRFWQYSNPWTKLVEVLMVFKALARLADVKAISKPLGQT